MDINLNINLNQDSQMVNLTKIHSKFNNFSANSMLFNDFEEKLTECTHS